MKLSVASLARRPDLVPLLDRFPGAWPAFMYHDPLSGLLYAHAAGLLAAYCLVGYDPDRPDVPLAKAYSAPVHWTGDPAADLPDGGWDAMMLHVVDDALARREPNLVSALEITVQPEYRGAGLSRQMLDALRENTARLGYRDLVAPVRPNGKHRYPELSIERYLDLRRPDGLSEDPWLRTHQRAGGRIVRIAPRSMTIVGSLAEWREWTGLPFAESGPVQVPQALAPVACDVTAGWGVYVEPNVWVHHKLTAP